MYLHPYMGSAEGVYVGEWDDSHVRDREERRPTDTQRETEPVGSGRAGGEGGGGGGCSHAQSPRTCPTGHQFAACSTVPIVRAVQVIVFPRVQTVKSRVQTCVKFICSFFCELL
jgi:hypothetical protein